jgi:hypothetical protein
MDDPEFWKIALAVAAPLCFFFGFRNWRLARLIDDTPTSRVRSAAQGYVELSGIARLADGKPNLAPLTRLPCVWWMFRIEQRTGSGRNRRWETIDRGTSVAQFLLEDDTGACLVDPQGADVRPGHQDSWSGSSAWPGPPGERRGFFSLGSDEFRYTEHRIQEREHVNVIGEFRTLGGIAAADVTGRVARLLEDWKSDQSALLRRFDANHDGVLTQAEWEQARAIARALIERQPPQAPTEQSNIVARPRDGRPFLVAACDLRKLAERSRMAAAALLAGFLVAVTALALMVFGPA